MNKVERARILLETALAKQRGVSLDEISSIPVDYGRTKGIDTYTGNSAREINRVLRANNANEWEPLAKDWQNQQASENGIKYALFYDKPGESELDKRFGDYVLRGAIAAENELLENPSPYSPEIRNALQYPLESLPGGSKRADDPTKPYYALTKPEPRMDAKRIAYSGNDLHLTPELSYKENPLYRGLHFPNGKRSEFLDWLEKDGVDKGFASVTGDLGIANRFATRDGESLLWRIDPSIKESELDSIAHPRWAFNEEEDEYIYLPGTKFNIKEIYTGKNVQSALGGEDKTKAEMLIDVVPTEVELPVSSRYLENNKEALDLMQKRKMLEQKLAYVQKQLAPTVINQESLRRFLPVQELEEF